MTNFLLCSLYGPMASWGDIAVGEVRPTQGHPTKSAVMGMIAAALGIKRDDESAHIALSEAYGFAVRIDSSGGLLRDYHTVQVPPPDRGRRYYTRKDEMGVDKHQMNTILSSRDYRVDAHYTIALWERGENKTPYTLQRVEQALRKPHFTLYLGRKSCPLAKPINPKVLQAENLSHAFKKITVCDEVLDVEQLSSSAAEPLATYCWEDMTLEETGFPLDGNHMVTERRDKISSRRRWQFMIRKEHHLTFVREAS